MSKTLSLTFLDSMEGGDNSNIDNVHAEISGIAALPNEDYTGTRVIYSPSAEFQKDGDTLSSPIGYISDPGNGVVFTGASPASKLCPTALPFIYDASNNSNETFKEDTPKHCEFGIHPVVLKLKLGTGPEFEGQLIA